MINIAENYKHRNLWRAMIAHIWKVYEKDEKHSVISEVIYCC